MILQNSNWNVFYFPKTIKRTLWSVWIIKTKCQTNTLTPQCHGFNQNRLFQSKTQITPLKLKVCTAHIATPCCFWFGAHGDKSVGRMARGVSVCFIDCVYTVCTRRSRRAAGCLLRERARRYMHKERSCAPCVCECRRRAYRSKKKKQPPLPPPPR